VFRPDIAFRTRSTRYHPEITPFRAGAPKPKAATPTRPATKTAAPRAAAPLA
jgi:hypothetical protein